MNLIGVLSSSTFPAKIRFLLPPLTLPSQAHFDLGLVAAAKKKAEPHRDSSILTKQWLDQSPDPFTEKTRLAYRAPSEAAYEIGDLVLDLTEAWTRQEGAEFGSAAKQKTSRGHRRHASSFGSSSEASEGEPAAENASTKRANSILKSMLSGETCSSLASKQASVDLSQRSCSRTTSNASTMSAKSSYKLGLGQWTSAFSTD